MTAREVVTLNTTAPRLEVPQTGDTYTMPVSVSVSDNIVIATSGKGIDFSATSDASGMTSELLDDYEEGTWTPTIQDASLSDAEGQTYSSQVGYYRKVGDAVFIKCRIDLTGLGTLTTGDQIRIGGLPFTSADVVKADSAIACSYGASLSIASGTNPGALILKNIAYAYVYIWQATSGSGTMKVSQLTATSVLALGGWYTV